MNYELLRHHDSAKIGLYKGVLEAEGIPVIVKNWECSNITEVPIPALYPTIFVNTPEDLKRSKEVIASAFQETEETLEDWVCPHCGETNEGQFAECWNCQSPRDSELEI